jgi:hypothetical protein
MAQPADERQSRPAARPEQPVRAAAQPPESAVTAACTCSHGRTAHEHYRRGTDCALCGCRKYHRPLLDRLRGPFRR